MRRNGYVSNSSSSSFLIFGFQVGGEEHLDALQSRDDRFDIFGSSDGPRYIGISWDGIADDETGAEFKDAIREAARVVAGVPADKCGTVQEAWYDG